MSTVQELIEEVAGLIKPGTRMLFITGAGMSADSGLPTYRGVGGLYNNSETEDGMPIEVAMSQHTLRTNPTVSWKYLFQVEHAARGAQPNRGHEVVAALESFGPVTVLTQNVDGLHQRAGSTDVIDIHGDMYTLICQSEACSWREKVSTFGHLAPLPRCPTCGGAIRPDVVLFGEVLDRAKVARLHGDFEEGFDIIFSVGTTSVFPYIAFPVQLGAEMGLPTVEINPARSKVSKIVKYRIQAGAAETLDAIFQKVQSKK